MAAIVFVHGVGQQMKGSHLLRQSLMPALLDGLALAGVEVGPESVAFASYGDLFRPRGEVLSPTPYFDLDDITEDYEEEMLACWWRRAAEVDERVVPPDVETLARAPRWAGRALVALTRSKFFSGVAEAALIGDLKQVRAYFDDPKVRAEVRSRVVAVIAADTRVLVGHSLGSVVAYETLCSMLDCPVRALVTLGSPLGLRNLIFDRLDPRPTMGEGVPRGAWPGPVTHWTNVADQGDVVAAVEDLRPLFGPEVRQIRVFNGAHAHDASPYLSERLIGIAIAEALT